jgi:hypothetical protein
MKITKHRLRQIISEEITAAVSDIQPEELDMTGASAPWTIKIGKNRLVSLRSPPTPDSPEGVIYGKPISAPIVGSTELKDDMGLNLAVSELEGLVPQGENIAIYREKESGEEMEIVGDGVGRMASRLTVT